MRRLQAAFRQGGLAALDATAAEIAARESEEVPPLAPAQSRIGLGELEGRWATLGSSGASEIQQNKAQAYGKELTELKAAVDGGDSEQARQLSESIQERFFDDADNLSEGDYLTIMDSLKSLHDAS